MADKKDEMLGKIDNKLDEVSDGVHSLDKQVALQKAAFDEHIKQDELMYQEFKRMNDILQQNTESLKEHMAQTRLLKETVLKIDQRLAPIEVERIEKAAIKKYRAEKIKKIAKILGIITMVGGIIAATWPFILKLAIVLR